MMGIMKQWMLERMDEEDRRTQLIRDLRNIGVCYPPQPFGDLLIDAADEIEILLGEVARLRRKLGEP